MPPTHAGDGPEAPPGPGPSAEAVLDALFRGDVGLCLVDPGGRIHRASARWLRLMGLPADEAAAAGRLLWDVLPDPPGGLRELLARAQAGEAVDAPEQRRPLDGRDAWYAARLSPVAFPDGAGVLFTAWDVTERRATLDELRRRAVELEALAGARKAAEEAAHEREATLDAFFEMSPGILNLTDADLRYLKVDGTTPRYFGLTRETLIGRSVADLSPAFVETYGPMLRRIVETGEPRLGVEVSGPVPDRPGEIAHWHASYFAVPLPGGRRGLGVVGVEITELKKAEQALREAHERLRAHVETTPLALVEWDAEYRVRRFSRRAEETFGWSAEEVLGRRIDEIPWVPDEDWPAVRGVMRDMAMHARPTNVSRNRNLRKDGAIIHCEWYNSTLYDEAGRVASILSLVLDVTGRERATEELRRANAILETVSKSTPVLVALKDRASRLLYANPAVLALNGRPAGENLGRDDVERFGPEIGAPLVENDRRVMRNRATESVEEVTPDGRVWLSTKTPWLDERGEVRGVIVVANEITSRKQSEQALRDLDRRKDHFLAVLSHELRNPLAPIRNAIVLLERAAPGSPVAGRAMEILRRQGDQLSRLVDDLLDLSRITHGKLDVELVPSDARELARRAHADARAQFDARGVRLELVAPEPAWIEADASRFAQIVGNLLHNALKFTPPGGLVQLEVARRTGTCEIVVKDTGRGFGPADEERIFEPFEQLGDRGAGAGEGLGLGLALVRELARKHRGSVRAWSAGPGRGAEFVVQLPLAAGGPGRGPDGRGGRPAPGPLRIVIVEDNEDAAVTLEDLLVLGGHRISRPADGATGVRLVTSERPDVLICDVGLPDMSGHQVVESVRRLEQGPPVFAIALTGYAQPEDRERALAAGFDAHLPKPPSLAALDALLAQVAAARRPPTN